MIVLATAGEAAALGGLRGAVERCRAADRGRFDESAVALALDALVDVVEAVAVKVAVGTDEASHVFGFLCEVVGKEMGQKGGSDAYKAAAACAGGPGL